MSLKRDLSTAPDCNSIDLGAKLFQTCETVSAVKTYKFRLYTVQFSSLTRVLLTLHGPAHHFEFIGKCVYIGLHAMHSASRPSYVIHIHT